MIHVKVTRRCASERPIEPSGIKGGEEKYSHRQHVSPMGELELSDW